MKLDEVRKLYPDLKKPATPAEQQALVDFLLSKGIDMSSSYQELEMTSRYVDAHRDATFSNSMVQLHSHNFYELLCCTNTCGAEYLVGSRRYRLQKGDIIFISPGVSHRPILPERMTEPYSRDVVWLSTEFLRLLARNSPELAPAQPRSTDLLRTADSRWAFLPELIHSSVLEYESQLPGWQSVLIGNAMAVVIHLSRAFRDKRTIPLKAEKPELLDQIMAYIEANYRNPFSLADVAQAFYVSESTVSHLFREKMGVSFHRCLTQRRLIAAKELIRTGETLENVAIQVGFSDYSSFFRAFKKEYGVNPRQYRKLQARSFYESASGENAEAATFPTPRILQAPSQEQACDTPPHSKQ